MTETVLTALRDIADESVLFHSGLWGGPSGYRWASAEGTASGHVPQWEADAIALLVRRGLVRIEKAAGAQDDRVRLTTRGAGMLDYALAA
ncbi:hypothetical protein V5P93_002794 [Actinokineospora auranticolor]|uniref:Uncharacterized protein n=1 Tax=Actinokineospora auranticolor TaxID=155976 RepID=A0A2S6H0C3_9PSEU|nr:hypothetical protein [Actinokineospora auranticolor]PPK70934.1 hypothetical protein CLV40_101120 [Actinokineospora auranticolor]